MSTGGEMNIFICGYHSSEVVDSSAIFDQVRIEMNLHPEKLSVVSEVADRVISDQSRVQVLFSRHASFRFAYSPLQRFVGYLSVRLSEIASERKLSGGSRVLGQCIVDMGPIVFRGLQMTAVCPVYASGPNEDPDLVGWLALAFCVSGPRKALETAGLAAFKYLSVSIEAPPPAPRELRTLCIIPGETTSPVVGPSDKNGWRLEFKVASCADTDAIVNTVGIASHSGALSFAPNPLTLAVVLGGGAAPALEVRLLSRSGLEGRAVVLLSHDWLSSGRPVELVLPLRGAGGEKACSLPLAVHLSGLPTASDGTNPASLQNSLALKTSTMTSSLVDYELSFEELNVCDPDWHIKMELCVEACVSVFAAHGEGLKRYMHRTVVTMEDAERSAMVVSLALEGGEAAVLTVVARDAARPGCPEVPSIRLLHICTSKYHWLACRLLAVNWTCLKHYPRMNPSDVT
jgi:hypothetical protein